jgi:signal transduction histidine kinase
METGPLCILTCASFACEAAATACDPGMAGVTFKPYPDRCGRPRMSWDEIRTVVINPEQFGAIRIFGGCCLTALQDPPADLQHCRIIHLENCFELLTSTSTISKLLTEGSYLVSSGWLSAWRQHVLEWGFTDSTAVEFFADCSRQIVLFDTATSNAAAADLEQFSSFVQRPHISLPVGLDQMRFRMELCREEWRRETAGKAEQLAQRQLSDYAMAFDLLSTLARSVDEADVIRQTALLYQMLFAASEVAYIRFSDGCPVKVIHTDFSTGENDAELLREAEALTGEYKKIDSAGGFLLKVTHGSCTMGVVRIAGIAFPEYVDTYLNLALATIGVCGLALHNAHAFREIGDKNRELAKAHADLQSSHLQMLQQEKMASIGQLAAGVAHEINNPMGFITSNLGTLEKYLSRITEYLDAADRVVAESPAPAQAETSALRSRLKLDYIVKDTRHLIEESLEGATRVKNIVNDLKNLSRTDKDEMVQANLNKIFETALNIAGNEIKYVADIVRQMGDVPDVLCHPQQLSQVFINLLTNAGHAIDGHGTITIRSWKEGKNIYVSVADTGKGIPEDIRSRIFEPFFTTKDVGKGTGLGLSISYDILQKHGGGITVESDVGKGTTFIVQLPDNTVNAV